MAVSTQEERTPGSEQPIRKHDDAEQAYVIVRGTGLMRVGDEEQKVSEGTLVLVPPGTSHATRNASDAPVVFVSATSPPFDVNALDEVFCTSGTRAIYRETEPTAPPFLMLDTFLTLTIIEAPRLRREKHREEEDSNHHRGWTSCHLRSGPGLRRAASGSTRLRRSAR